MKNPVTPGAPILTDAGYPIAPAIFFGIAGPAGLPKEVLDKWDEVMAKVVKSEEFKSLAAARKWTLDFAGHADFTKTVKRDYMAAKTTIADIGMK